MSSGIYKITNTVNGRFYIGSAVSFNRRWNVHRSQLVNRKHHSVLLQRAWNKYGSDAFKFEILEYVPKENLIEVEQRYIDELRPCDPRIGYNISDKASCVCLPKEKNPNYGKPMSDEQKQKISETLMGHSISVKTRNAISKACKGKCAGEKHPMYGLPVSQERRHAQSEKMKGRFAGGRNPAARAVNQYDLRENFIEKFETLTDAAKSVNGDKANLVSCCKGKYKQAYGYIWRYAEEVIK
jgi:group I intron endonuclease